MAFWILIVILTRSKRTSTHSASPKKLIRTSFWIALTLLPWAIYDCVQGRFGASVFEMKTFEPDSKSIIYLDPAKQVVGETHV